MHIGGTGILLTMRSEGVAADSSAPIIRKGISSVVMRSNNCITTNGFRISTVGSSCAYFPPVENSNSSIKAH